MAIQYPEAIDVSRLERFVKREATTLGWFIGDFIQGHNELYDCCVDDLTFLIPQGKQTDIKNFILKDNTRQKKELLLLSDSIL